MNRFKARLTEFTGYVLDYAPIIVTVLLATLASLSAVRTNVPTGEMLQWILVVLALLATTQLIDRFRVMRSINVQIGRLSESVQGLSGAQALFTNKIPNLEQRLREAKSIAINGVTLGRTISSHWATFRQRLGEGTRIRLLVVDPTHSSVDSAASRWYVHQDSGRTRREIDLTLDYLRPFKLQEAFADLLQVRLFPSVPPYGIWLIDADSERAEIWVEFYTFRDETEPAIHLLPHRDGEWFALFEQQFETMWNASEVWEPEANAAVSG